MTPRSLDDIKARLRDEADADRFESFEPAGPGREIDQTAATALRTAATRRDEAEVAVLEAVIAARRTGMSWFTIGLMIGTSGEAARQRYGAISPPGRAKRPGRRDVG